MTSQSGLQNTKCSQCATATQLEYEVKKLDGLGHQMAVGYQSAKPLHLMGEKQRFSLGLGPKAPNPR